MATQGTQFTGVSLNASQIIPRNPAAIQSGRIPA
jgi:hypothetical protein